MSVGLSQSTLTWNVIYHPNTTKEKAGEKAERKNPTHNKIDYIIVGVGSGEEHRCSHPYVILTSPFVRTLWVRYCVLLIQFKKKILSLCRVKDKKISFMEVIPRFYLLLCKRKQITLKASSKSQLESISIKL